MKQVIKAVFILLLLAQVSYAFTEEVIDIPTRKWVTQRLLIHAPEAPQAIVVLFAGGHGGLQISDAGTFGWGEQNFLVRSRELFARHNLLTIVVDAPSDRQQAFLSGFRQKDEHVRDIKAVMAWAREKYTGIPVWLVGTSAGTLSAAYIATELTSKAGPDGLVLTATVVSSEGQTRPVPDMRLGSIKIPVLLVHHEDDGCSKCQYSEVQKMVGKFKKSPRTELLSFTGGSTYGDPCQAMTYHGFYMIEEEVVNQIAQWILAP